MTFEMERSGSHEDRLFSEAQKDIMLAAIEHYGTLRQILKAVEELEELSCELTRFANGFDDEHRISQIREELADVQVMAWQMEDIFGDVSSWRDAKLERLERRLQAGL